jgi:transcriptional regulator with GAF, ATPase, and Fis domain
MDGTRHDPERMLRRAASTALPILLYGASGSGKDVAARRIHALSDRRDRKFAVFNCAAIPESLAESTLFGSEKGGHSLAKELQIGLLESAGDGTIFLDEIAELSLQLQAKLLRALDKDGEFLRVGGKVPIKLRARVIAATNKDLRAEVEAGRFRLDLYHRIAVLVIQVPPLSARPKEVVKAAREYLAELAPDLGFAPCALEALVNRPWPGGFRELRNLIQRVVILGDVDDDITAADVRAWGEPAPGEAAPRAPPPRESSTHVVSRVVLREPPKPGRSVDATRWEQANTVGRWRVIAEAVDQTPSKRQAAKRLEIRARAWTGTSRRWGTR